MSGWLEQANACTGAARAVIAPHAGFSYSGPTAAWAYKHVSPTGIRRVFVLGPSHHHSMSRCAVSSCATYETPFGGIPVDRATSAALLETGAFDVMDLSVEEAEHSIEMHLPYILHVMGATSFELVPILVGALDEAAEARYGALLAPHLLCAENLWVVSSDFCHWGRRFRYTRYDAAEGAICQSIEALDRRAMGLIEAQDARGFAAYLRATSNTICGRHPIALLLHALENSRFSLQFVRYAQSSSVYTMDDSSVSYASAVVWEDRGDQQALEPRTHIPTD